MFGHSLANHPLFNIPRLIKLAESKKNPEDLYFNAGDIKVAQKWNQMPDKSMRFQEALEHVEKANAWIILKAAEEDPEYGALLDQCIDEIGEFLGKPIRSRLSRLRLSCLISSPGRITNYHIDSDCNFLFQISGEKDISVFDQDDRSVLTEPELERFWFGDLNAAEYKESLQAKAHVFRLQPGKVVHVPVNAPHWVRNGDNVSISVSMNFEFTDMRMANVYRANHVMRKLGLKPRPPGLSVARDAMKSAAIGGAIALRKLVRPGSGGQ